MDFSTGQMPATSAENTALPRDGLSCRGSRHGYATDRCLFQPRGVVGRTSVGVEGARGVIPVARSDRSGNVQKSMNVGVTWAGVAVGPGQNAAGLMKKGTVLG